MIARVSLEIALRKEFDYAIPPELAGQVDVGSRVQVPFGPRKVLGVVTALAEESAHANLKPILKVIGAQTLVTPKVLELARWIADYYCCAPEIALKCVLPEAVRKEDAGWRERLFVRVLPAHGRISQAAQAPAGSLEHHRGTARIAAAPNCSNWPKPPPPPSASWKIAAWSPSPRKSPSAIRTRTNTSCPRNRCSLNPGAGQRAGEDQGGDGNVGGTAASRRSFWRRARNRRADVQARCPFSNKEAGPKNPADAPLTQPRRSTRTRATTSSQ